MIQSWVLHHLELNWNYAIIDSLVTNGLLALACFAAIILFRYYQPGNSNRIYRLVFALSITILYCIIFKWVLTYLLGADDYYLSFLEKSMPIRFIISLLVLTFLTITNWLLYNLQEQKDREQRQNVAEQLVKEAELARLRQQLQPHFLFNTLGAVQQLAEQGSKDEQGQSKAAVLTANLIVFLRASMSEMRAEQVSLKDEFAMVEAYLEVMQVRMAHRLTFSLDLPPSYADYKIPSMVLLTLVENAIKHGLEPAIRGGSIHISAQAVVGNSTGSDLCITVQDTGVGLSDKPSHGIGLQNIRDRLRLAYSGKAGLEISEAEAGGVIAEISIPLSEGVLT